jgi:Fe2+ or Zn2+ uptake regulation protein
MSEMPTKPQAIDAELTASLRARGQRVTPQRLALNRALRGLDRHVTAEELQAAVSERLPGVSAPTIYATLELFEQLGSVRRIPHPGADLWDPRPDPHHHLVCRACGSIEDLDAGVDAGRAVRAARRRGFRPDGAQLTITGLCARCAGRPGR